jgi:hypothetical protein
LTLEITSVCLLSSVLFIGATTVRGQGLQPSCDIPFASIKQHHPIDDTCPADGTATRDPQRLQNEAKNNFCATGSPAEVTPLSFKKLQAASKNAGVTFGSDASLPADRSALQGLYKTSNGDTIGEGSLVRLVAFLIDAHYSNVSGGESVNCKTSGKESNDIHILLGKTAQTAPCSSVTAEMSPHFRPTGWTPDALNGLNGHPIRLTGQLFFDASHKPCTPGHSASPPRISLWEIHPIYAADVCKNTTLAACGIADDSVWTALDQWGAGGGNQ